MVTNNNSKVRWVAFVLAAAVMILTIKGLGQIFFLNHTSSMPKGIYLKIWDKELNIGDIIVFNSIEFGGNLIKYIAANNHAEYCHDGAGSFWTDGITYSQNYIKIIDQNISAQSVCRRLNRDELVVLGEHPDSYDSRYFGPIKRKDILAKVKLVYGFEE